MDGISALMKEILESSLALSYPLGHSKETVIFEPGRWPSPDTESAGALILDFPASKTVRNKCLLFKPPRLWYVFIAAGMDKIYTIHTCVMNAKSQAFIPDLIRTCILQDGWVIPIRF